MQVRVLPPSQSLGLIRATSDRSNKHREMRREKYRPSNGTEGDGFMDHYCANCIHEKFWHTQNHKDKQCDILSRTMLYDVDEPQYPSEWTYDESDRPICTAWSKWDWGRGDDPGGWNEPPEPEPDDPNQLCLPFELNAINKEVNNPELLTPLP